MHKIPAEWNSARPAMFRRDWLQLRIERHRMPTNVPLYHYEIFDAADIIDTEFICSLQNT